MKKIKTQVVMLPTNEKADLFLWEAVKLRYKENNTGWRGSYQYLYFLSDEEIKEGDWYLNNSELSKGIGKCLSIEDGIIYAEQFKSERLTVCKKIIATTDNSLRIITGYSNLIIIGKDGEDEYVPITSKLPQPSQSFLEVFVKEYNNGNVIKEVMVEYNEDGIVKKGRGGDRYITVKKIKDSWNREEVLELLKFGIGYGYTCGVDKTECYDNKWIEQNL